MDSSDIKMQSEQQDVEDEEEGPPPGWHSKPPPQPPVEITPSGGSPFHFGVHEISLYFISTRANMVTDQI